jgi:hypothetical protein
MQPVAVIKHSNILQYILLRRTAGLVVLPLVDRSSITVTENAVRPEPVEGRCQLLSGLTSSPRTVMVLLERSTSTILV